MNQSRPWSIRQMKPRRERRKKASDRPIRTRRKNRRPELHESTRYVDCGSQHHLIPFLLRHATYGLQRRTDQIPHGGAPAYVSRSVVFNSGYMTQALQRDGNSSTAVTKRVTL